MNNCYWSDTELAISLELRLHAAFNVGGSNYN